MLDLELFKDRDFCGMVTVESISKYTVYWMNKDVTKFPLTVKNPVLHTHFEKLRWVY